MPRLLLPLIFLLSLPAAAQDLSPVVVNQPGIERALLDLPRGDIIPDTTEPWRYFPLEMGNTWEYLTTDHLIERRYVERDTLIDGKTYFIFNRQYFTPDGASASQIVWDPPIRFDTLMAHVMRTTAVGDQPHYFDCPFDTPFGSTCHSPIYGDVAVSGGYDRLLVFPPPDGADSVYTAVKGMSRGVLEYRFAADFGEVFHHCSECGFGWGLRAVRIGGWDGEVYGELLVPPPQVSSEEPPPLERIMLSAWPNPFREHLSISLTVDGSGPAVVALYDLLGREVLRRDLGPLSPGEHTVRLETQTLPAGAYVLRAETGDGGFLTSAVLTRVR
jgi:hypothetical protein